MPDQINEPSDMKDLAAKVLAVEAQIEAVDGVPDAALMARWCSLMGKLRGALCRGPKTRGTMRVPVGARVAVRRRTGAKPVSLSCEDISYAGCRVVGDLSTLQVGDTVQLVQVADSSSEFELTIVCTVVWQKKNTAQRGAAGLKFAGVSGSAFNEFYLSSYKRYLGELSAGRAPSVH